MDSDVDALLFYFGVSEEKEKRREMKITTMLKCAQNIRQPYIHVNVAGSKRWTVLWNTEMLSMLQFPAPSTATPFQMRTNKWINCNQVSAGSNRNKIYTLYYGIECLESFETIDQHGTNNTKQ